MKIRTVITGRFYHTTGSLPEELTLADGATVDDALAELAGHLPADQGLPESCLVAVSGRHVGTVSAHESARLSDGDELVVIAPVAGG
jgi:molybdopterin converting factor small subunit